MVKYYTQYPDSTGRTLDDRSVYVAKSIIRKITTMKRDPAKGFKDSILGIEMEKGKELVYDRRNLTPVGTLEEFVQERKTKGEASKSYRAVRYIKYIDANGELQGDYFSFSKLMEMINTEGISICGKNWSLDNPEDMIGSTDPVDQVYTMWRISTNYPVSDGKATDQKYCLNDPLYNNYHPHNRMKDVINIDTVKRGFGRKLMELNRMYVPNSDYTVDGLQTTIRDILSIKQHGLDPRVNISEKRRRAS